MININNSDDSFYRYKMEIIQISNCGNGNGQFTIIKNMNKIEKSLNTPAEILFKFIAFALGSSYNNKKNSITGTHTQEIIELKLFTYINNFVICLNCGIPELTYTLIKKKLECKCSACGKQNEIKAINKIILKGLDLILKYLETGKNWISTKGTMVIHNNIDDNIDNINDNIDNNINNINDNIDNNIDDDFNPF